MRTPRQPKPFAQILADIRPEQLERLIGRQVGPLVDGRYLHWDQLRHRTPPDGIDHDLWWLGIKLARNALAQPLPLEDQSGKPFTFGVPEAVQIDLHHVDQDAAGQIRAPNEVTTPERRDAYLLRSLMEEAVTSSQLEGASTTRRAAVAMLREGRKPRDRSERMIFNNFRTMQAIQAFREEPVTVPRLLELHSLVSEGTLAEARLEGCFRQTDDIRVVHPSDGTVLHQPPRYPELPARMERICQFANASENDRPFVHPVIRAILLHFMIGYDHPFEDGNGRTARALFYWSMLRSGYWLTGFLSISRILKRAPAQYARAYLFTETDDGDATYFILHQLETIRRAIAGLYDYLALKSREQQDVEHLLASAPLLRSRLNYRQRALLGHALKHPGTAYRIDAHQRSHGTSYQTARTDLMALADLGFLGRAKEGKAFLFYAQADLEQRLRAMAEPGR
jgi:Fic family protein